MYRKVDSERRTTLREGGPRSSKGGGEPGSVRPCTVWLWGRESSPKTQRRCSSQSKSHAHTHTQKGRSLSPCTCLTVASKDIHYKYIYICTYIYICIYILSFYVHIYYSQILNTQHRGVGKGKWGDRRGQGYRGCVYITLFCRRNIAKLCSRSLENDYYTFRMSKEAWQQTFLS